MYTSLDPITAWMEAQQGFPFKPQPMTLVAYQVDCADIADLNEPKILQAMGYSPADLACAWEDLISQKHELPTWQLTDQLQSFGIAGVLTRIFAPGCSEQNHNLILWEWSDVPSQSIQVIDDFGRLPKSKESWTENHHRD